MLDMMIDECVVYFQWVLCAEFLYIIRHAFFCGSVADYVEFVDVVGEVFVEVLEPVLNEKGIARKG